jgi:hypothetical protein
MDEEFDPIDLQCKSTRWMMNEASKLIQQWKDCKTAHAKNRLLPKLEAIRATLKRENREMKPLYDMIKEGEEWKDL